MSKVSVWAFGSTATRKDFCEAGINGPMGLTEPEIRQHGWYQLGVLAGVPNCSSAGHVTVCPRTG